jgi:hypothetical protein
VLYSVVLFGICQAVASPVAVEVEVVDGAVR